jgi:hypothetical protein
MRLVECRVKRRKETESFGYNKMHTIRHAKYEREEKSISVFVDQLRIESVMDSWSSRTWYLRQISPIMVIIRCNKPLTYVLAQSQ